MAFPEQIFDGTHGFRPDMSINTAPGYMYYVFLVRELQAVQKFVLDFVTNMKVMPNLEQYLKEAMAEIDKVKALCEGVTPPEDLINHLKELQEQIKTVDIRETLAHLQIDLEGLRDIVIQSQLTLLQTAEEVREESKGFQHQIWYAVNGLKNGVEERLASLEEQMTRVNSLVQISNLLGKLK